MTGICQLKRGHAGCSHRYLALRPPIQDSPHDRVGSPLRNSTFPSCVRSEVGHCTVTLTLRSSLRRNNFCSRPSHEVPGSEWKKGRKGESAAGRPGARHWRLNIKCREKSVSAALLAISDVSFQRERLEFRDIAHPLFSCPPAFGASVDGTTGRG